MKKNNKLLIIILTIIVTLMMGYALFSENITVTGTATASGNFDIGYTCQTGLANVAGIYDNAFNSLNGQETENSYSDDSCSIIDNKITFKTNLTAPGAMRYYTVKITNNGTIPALAPYQGSRTTEVCMNEEMKEALDITKTGYCGTRLFDYQDKINTGAVVRLEGSYNFEDFSFVYIIEKNDGTLVNLYQIPEEEAMTYLTDDGDRIKLEPGYTLYYVGKMYIPPNYDWYARRNDTELLNMIDFNLKAEYTLNITQQTN